MAIQRTFTGENTGIKIQPLDRMARSQERMDDMLTKADQIRYSTFKENQSKFLNAMNVDTETYLSTANAEAQSKLIDEYNSKAQALLKSRGGRFENFTTQDWVELQKGRKYIESAQAKMNTDLERFKMDEQLMKRDGGRNYDPDEWNNIKKTYLQTGVYSEDPLPVKEKAFEGYLSQRSKNYTDKLQAELETTTLGGIKQKRTAWVNMTPEQAKEEIKQGILLNDGERKNVMKRFAALPVQEQAKWLDTNRDGKVDKTEQGDENGIIAWAQQYQPFLSALIKEDTSMYSNVGTNNKTTFDWNIGIGSGHNQNNQFPVRGQVDIATILGKATLPNSLDFSGLPRTTTDARKINTVLEPDGKGGYKETPLGEAASFDIITYSPQDDVIVIKLKSDTSDFAYKEGDVLVVKGSEFDDLLKRKPFGISREIYNKPQKTTPTAQTKTVGSSGVDWKKKK